MVLFDGLAITAFESRQNSSKRIIGSSCENKTRELRLHHVFFNYFESLQSFMESLPKEKIQKKNEKKGRLFSQKETLLILYYAIKEKIYYLHSCFFFTAKSY